ncbi:restriction endonuclease [Entomobacter blattae]|uniref:Restriction endonuclease n=1 Tax=Entomobacter blattae TaxID=2762277 RepID=A0A7H1NU31_9PROT|nr:restriction endonuclease [Entomobacter blattae]QNT79291.1 Restriction endonuclease [Entomobacter blattae]
MGRLVNILICGLFLVYPHIAFSSVLEKSGNWETNLNSEQNVFYIQNHDHNALLTFYIDDHSTPLLTAILTNSIYNTENVVTLELEAGDFRTILSKDMDATNSLTSFYKADIPIDKLKDFIHGITAMKTATLTIGEQAVPISLSGTTPVVNAILKYLTDHNVTSFPAPFTVQPKIEIKQNRNIDEDKPQYSETKIIDQNKLELEKRSHKGNLNYIVIFIVFITVILFVSILFKIYSKIKKAIQNNKDKESKNRSVPSSYVTPIENTNTINDNNTSTFIELKNKYQQEKTPSYPKTIYEEKNKNSSSQSYLTNIIKNNFFSEKTSTKNKDEEISDYLKQVKKTVEINKNKAIELARKKLHEHLPTLQRKYSTLVKYDDYGIPDLSKWETHVNYFINKIILPYLLDERVGHYFKPAEYVVRKEIKAVIKASREENEGTITKQGLRFSPTMKPTTYEKYCNQLLEESGWKTELTPLSNDQGADIIATKNSETLIVQCKLYSKPIGNKAVQEAISAKKFYNAQYGAVVSNQEYTSSARQLAKSDNILLLHHDQLKDFEAVEA